MSTKNDRLFSLSSHGRHSNSEFEWNPGYSDGLKENEIRIFLSFRMDPKGHTEAITEIVQEGLPGVPGMRLQIKILSIYIKRAQKCL